MYSYILLLSARYVAIAMVAGLLATVFLFKRGLRPLTKVLLWNCALFLVMSTLTLACYFALASLLFPDDPLSPLKYADTLEKRQWLQRAIKACGAAFHSWIGFKLFNSKLFVSSNNQALTKLKLTLLFIGLTFLTPLLIEFMIGAFAIMTGKIGHGW